MLKKKLRINHLAVLILVLFNLFLGFIWYSNYFFGNEWMRLLGKTSGDFANAGIMPFIVATITSIVTIYTIAWVFKKMEVENFLSGFFYGVLFWFGFVFCEFITVDQFELRHYGLTWINAGKSLVTFAVSGFVLGMWKRYSEVEVKEDVTQATGV